MKGLLGRRENLPAGILCIFFSAANHAHSSVNIVWMPAS
jgi:hypothetical protein